MKMLVTVQLSKHKYKTPEGYLVCQDAILSRTGKQQYMKCEVFPEEDSDEIIDVDRLEEDVFDEHTMSSFENKPVCCEHPEENVTPENYRDLSVGHVYNIHRGSYEGKPVMLGDLMITDASIIEDIENGIRTDLSCGYDCDIVEDGKGHYKQTNIRGNHVALCEQGRAGIARIVDSIWKKPITDSIVKGSLIQEFGKQGKQYKITKINGNVIYAESLIDGKNVLFKKDEENIEWAIISKSEVKDSDNTKYRIRSFSYAKGKEIIIDDDLSLEDAKQIFENYVNSCSEFNKRTSFPSEFIVYLEEDKEKGKIINLYQITEKGKIIKDSKKKVKDYEWLDSEPKLGLYVNGKFVEPREDAWKMAKKLLKEDNLAEFYEYWIDEFGYPHETDLRNTVKRIISKDSKFNNGKLEDFDISKMIEKMKESKESLNSIRIAPDGKELTIFVFGRGPVNKPDDLYIDIISEDEEGNQERIYDKDFETYEELIEDFNKWKSNYINKDNNIKDAAELDTRIIDAIHQTLGEDVKIDFGARGQNIVIRYNNKVSPYMANANVERLMKTLERLEIKVDEAQTRKHSNEYAIEVWHNSNLAWGDIRQFKDSEEEFDKEFYEKALKKLERRIKKLDKEIDENSDDEEYVNQLKSIKSEVERQIEEYKTKISKEGE